MKSVLETTFQRRFSSTGFRLWRNSSATRRPLVKVYRHIGGGFIYLGLGPVAVWKDGRRMGWGRR